MGEPGAYGRGGWRALCALLGTVALLVGLLWLVRPYGGALCAAWLLLDAAWRGVKK